MSVYDKYQAWVNIYSMRKIIIVILAFQSTVYAQSSSSTTIDTTITINSNSSLLFGITFDCRTSMLDNMSNPVGYYDVNGTIIPGLNAVFSNFQMSSLRYPANGIQKGFNWKKSIGLPASSRPPQDILGAIGPPQPVIFGFDEFMAMTASKGVLPQDVQIMVPIYDSAIIWTSTQQTASVPNALQLVADWVEYANAPNDNSNPGGGIDWAVVRATNGHSLPYGIKIWNMGNEPWASGEFGNTVAGCNNYLSTITPMIDAMLLIDSTIQITLATVGAVTSNWNTTIMNSVLVAQGKIYGISPHYFPTEPTNSVFNVANVLSVLSNTAQTYGLVTILGDYAPNIPIAANQATQDSAMQWGGANLSADLLMMVSQLQNVERVNFWTYGIPVAVYHPVRVNFPGNYTLMPVARLYEELFPVVLDRSLSVTNSSPVASDGIPYSVRAGAFASNDLLSVNVVAVNRDKLITHTFHVYGISGFSLLSASLLNSPNLSSDVVTSTSVAADVNGDFTIPPMGVLILKYANPLSVWDTNPGAPVIGIYPNPAGEVISFTEELHDISIFNVLGQLMITGIKSAKELSVAILPEGSYFIRSANHSDMFVVQRR